ncbi:hypothetical protein KSS87_011917 [Heliosperma pusillum]|nr:hypothetical protein KSS87_011917 [Heliosperma pusillum]
MAASPKVSEVKVADLLFPPSVKPPGTHNSFFLAGAGVRGMEIGGNFVKFTAIGVYLEESAINELAPKWKGKSAADLADSVEFFRDFVTGPFEKFTQVTMILPLTGQQYADKVTENCVKFWKSIGIYTDEEATAVDKFIEVFKDENFPPGHSIMFTQSPTGSLTVAFSKHESIPQVGKAVIDNKNMSEAVLESIIGKHGVSPEAKQSIAARVSALLNDEKVGSDPEVATGVSKEIAPESTPA